MVLSLTTECFVFLYIIMFLFILLCLLFGFAMCLGFVYACVPSVCPWCLLVSLLSSVSYQVLCVCFLFYSEGPCLMWLCSVYVSPSRRVWFLPGVFPSCFHSLITPLCI